MKTQQIPILGPKDFGGRFPGENTGSQQFLKPVNDFFHINRIEDHINTLKAPMPPHRKSIYVFIFFTKGSTLRTKGLDPYRVGENTFFFLPPFQTTSRKQMSPDAAGYFCHFDPDIFIKHFYQKDLLTQFPFLNFIGDPLVTITPELLPWVLNILNRLEELYTSAQPDLDVAGAYLLTLFWEISHFKKDQARVTENAAVRVTETYNNALMQHIYTKQRVSDYAELLSITPDYLNRCIKLVTGKTSRALMEEMLILESKVLLNQSSLNVSDVAFKIGKENVSNFSRFFKSKTGVTPRDYKLHTDQSLKSDLD